MPELSLENIFSGFIESMLAGRFSNRVVNIELDCFLPRSNDPVTGASCNGGRDWISLVVSAPGNYVLVGWKFFESDDEHYTRTSYHDSCWRSDGFNFLRKYRQILLREMPKVTHGVIHFFDNDKRAFRIEDCEQLITGNIPYFFDEK